MFLLIGLSLSRCIRDILDGKVDLDQVHCIFSGTMYSPTLVDRISRIISDHFTTWKAEEEEITKILEDLFFKGKIVQPRLIPGQERWGLTLGHGHWAVVMDQSQLKALDELGRLFKGEF